MQRLLLIDGHYYAFRSFYAIAHLSNSRGEPTNAVYGYVKAVQRMLADVKPDFAAAIFDDGPPARLALRPDYKSTRKETPEALVRQIPWIHQAVEALGMKNLSIYGEEADDLIASYTRVAEKQGYETVIATNDKDLLQLVDEKCRIYQPGKDTFEFLDAAAVEKKWGVRPDQISDLLALAGDSVDAIAGVPGIGPKTAAQLIRQFGVVDVMLNKTADISSARLRSLIEEHAELILENQIFLKLRDQLALPQPIEKLVLQPNDAAQLVLFEMLEFKTLLAQTRARLQKKESSESQTAAQCELF